MSKARITGLTEESQTEVVSRARADLKSLMEKAGVKGSVGALYSNSTEAFRNDVIVRKALKTLHREEARLNRLRHPETVATRSRERYRSHPEEAAKCNRAWYERNSEKVKANVRTWQIANPVKARRLWRQASRRRRALTLNSHGDFTEEEFRVLCVACDSKCSYCGGSEAEVGPLVPDHMVPLSRGGSNDIGNITPACGPCNDSKGSKTVDEFLGLDGKEDLVGL